MKYLVALALFSVALMGCADNKVASPTTANTDPTQAEATPAVFNAAGAPTVQFSVPDMVCESCSAAVHETLAAQPGAKEVAIDLEEKVATVAIDQAAFEQEAALAALLDKQFSNAKLLEPSANPTEADASVKTSAETEPSDG